MLKLSTCACELELEDHILWDAEDVLNIEAPVPAGVVDMEHFLVPGFRTG